MAAASPLMDRSSAALLKLSSELPGAASGLRHRSSQNTTGDAMGSTQLDWSFEKTRCSTSLIGDQSASTDIRPAEDAVEDDSTGVSRPCGKNTPSGEKDRVPGDMPDLELATCRAVHPPSIRCLLPLQPALCRFLEGPSCCTTQS